MCLFGEHKEPVGIKHRDYISSSTRAYVALCVRHKQDPSFTALEQNKEAVMEAQVKRDRECSTSRSRLA